MVALQRDLCAMPIWLLRDYLVKLGGQEQADGWVHGQGWRARLTQIEDYQIGSICVGQVRLEVMGEDAGVAAMWEQLEPKLMRAGG